MCKVTAQLVDGATVPVAGPWDPGELREPGAPGVAADSGEMRESGELREPGEGLDYDQWRTAGPGVLGVHSQNQHWQHSAVMVPVQTAAADVESQS